MSKGFDVTIDLQDEALNSALSRAISAGEDMTQPMADIADDWMSHIRARFDQEQDPMGMPWTKRRNDDGQDDGHPLLQKSRALFNQIVPEFGRDFATVGVLRTGGPARYARIHNEGGTIEPRKAGALSFGGRIVSKVVMPRRQYIGFGPAENASVVDVMTDWLARLFGEPA